MNDNSEIRLLLTPGRRLGLLACLFVVCYVVLSVLAAVVVTVFGETSTPAMRILTVVQDVLVFIVPAVATAMLVTRTPDRMLAINKAPSFLPLVVAILTLLVAVPAMNCLIAFNESLPLPREMADALREMENSASDMIAAVTGPHTIPNLVMTILIIGVMAGLSEELLFRGCLQRLLSLGGMNTHVAIWTAAAVFSILHLQFYGFLPRMALGAFFGYLLWWTRSLWVPVIVHAFNNTVYLIEQYRNYGAESESEIGADGNVLIVAASVILTAAGLYIIYRLTHKKTESAPAAS